MFNSSEWFKNINSTIDGYSIWNSKISFYTLANAINTFMDVDLPIYSFGSGDGRLEKYYNDKFLKNKIICIEPRPGIFNKSPVVLQPKYSDIDQLINSEPSVVENSQAIIIWADISSKYDIDVIKKLKPKKLLVLWESTGCAGSEEFNDYLYNNTEYILTELISEYHDMKGPFGPEEKNFIVITFEKKIKKN